MTNESTKKNFWVLRAKHDTMTTRGGYIPILSNWCTAKERDEKECNAPAGDNNKQDNTGSARSVMTREAKQAEVLDKDRDFYEGC